MKTCQSGDVNTDYSLHKLFLINLFFLQLRNIKIQGDGIWDCLVINQNPDLMAYGDLKKLYSLCVPCVDIILVTSSLMIT